MDMAQIMERIKYVEDRVFCFIIMNSDTKKMMASWGRVFKSPGVKLAPEDVPDNQVCTVGARPAEALGFAQFPIGSRMHPKFGPALKAMNMFSPLAEVPAGPDALSNMLMVELDAIKAFLKPGQKLRDVCIGTSIRQDRAVALGKQIEASGIPVEGCVIYLPHLPPSYRLRSQCLCFLKCVSGAGRPITIMDTLIVASLIQYGEYMVMYWIDDA